MTILILMGGAKRIANFSSLFVPVMALSYIVVGFIVVIMNYKNIPSVITLIFSSAFRADAAFGDFWER